MKSTWQPSGIVLNRHRNIYTHTHLNWNIHWIFLPFLAACCACDRSFNSYSIFNIMSSYLLVSHIKDSFSCVAQVNQCGLVHTIHFISQLNGIHRVCFEYVFNLFQRWRKKKKEQIVQNIYRWFILWHTRNKLPADISFYFLLWSGSNSRRIKQNLNEND